MNQTDALEQWTRDWRVSMLRFARLHIQPDEEAEDAVQDALLAACACDTPVMQQRDPRPYLFGIADSRTRSQTVCGASTATPP